LKFVAQVVDATRVARYSLEDQSERTKNARCCGIEASDG
jgi:hypothetical protein